MLSVFLAALAGTVAAQIAPGPNLLAVANTALSQGRAAGVCVAAGVASGVLVWVAAFAFGVSALFETYPAAGIALQLLGGGYFLFLAVKALASARSKTRQTLNVSSTPATLSRAYTRAYTRAYRRGFLVVLTNPKAAMMWAAVTAFLSGSGLQPMGVMAFAPIGAFSSLIVYSGYAFLFSTSTAVRAYDKVSGRIELVFGSLFGALGFKFIADGLREIRNA